MIFGAGFIEERRKVDYIQYFLIIRKRSVKIYGFCNPVIDSAVRMRQRINVVIRTLLYILELKGKARGKLRFKHFHPVILIADVTSCFADFDCIDFRICKRKCPAVNVGYPAFKR